MKSFGKSYQQYLNFISDIKSGKNYIVIGPGYVVISEGLFKTINATKHKIIIEYLEEINKVDSEFYKKYLKRQNNENKTRNSRRN